MFIKHISVKNFKSFEKTDVDLRKLNYLVGSNASGKSNFISIFSFLKNITEHGLDNAISMEGGFEYLRNRRVDSSEDITIGIVYDPKIRMRIKPKTLRGIEIAEEKYEFSLTKTRSGKGYKVVKDELTLHYNFYELMQKDDRSISQGSLLGKFDSTITVRNGKISLSKDMTDLMKDDIKRELQKDIRIVLPTFIKDTEIQTDQLFLEHPVFQMLQGIENPINKVKIYDFDPKQPKKAVAFTGKNELEDNGSNLSIVLKKIQNDKELKRKFINLIKDLLPFVGDVRIKSLTDKSLLFVLQENVGNKSTELPASFISDGTVNLVSIIVALYFEKNTASVLEEPERNIHPHLISRLSNMFEEVSRDKQLIITTHNSEFVRHAKLENILLIHRNNKGHSSVSRPVENEEVKMFLENELGIDELFVQRLLGE